MNEPNKQFIHFHLLGSGITIFIIIIDFDWNFFRRRSTGALDLQFIIPLTFIAIVIPMIKSISTLFVGYKFWICSVDLQKFRYKF